MASVKKKIRFGLIGCGAISKKHCIAISRQKDAEIVGAYDIDEKSTTEFNKNTGIEVFNNIDDMIEKTNPDILSILTPSGLHAKNILELITYKKHFVVEKPIALRLDDVDEIIKQCDANGLKIFVVQQNRFNPPIQKLKESIDKGRFGKLILGTIRVRWSRRQPYYDQKPWRGTWSYDGGVFTNQASHHIDMLIWMMGPVESVVAKTSTMIANIEAEDTGVALIKFKNGGLGIIEATTATRPKDLEGSISILGEKGSVEVGGFFMNELKIWQFEDQDKEDSEIWEKYSSVPNEVAWNHSKFIEDVIYSIKENKGGLIDGLEGRKSIELINAIYESSETGKEVNLIFKPKACKLGVE